MLLGMDKALCPGGHPQSSSFHSFVLQLQSSLVFIMWHLRLTKENEYGEFP